MSFNSQLGSLCRFAVLPLLAFALALVHTTGAGHAAGGELSFRITDNGADQPWRADRPLVGMPLALDSLLFSSPKTTSLVVSMPTNDKMDLFAGSPETLVSEIEKGLRAQISEAIAEGRTDFEIHLIQNIQVKNVLPTYAFPSQQARIEVFTRAAYTAFGNLANDLRASASNIAVDFTAGSNGTVGLAKSANVISSFGDLIRRITLVDGRAMEHDVVDLIRTVGASKIRIINSHGDAPAIPPTPFPTPRSIANFDISLGIQEQFPDVTLLKLRPDHRGLGHIRTMTQPHEYFEVEQHFADGTFRSLGHRQGHEIHARFSPTEYAAFNQGVPAVGSSYADARGAFAPRPPIPETIHRVLDALPSQQLEVSRTALEDLATNLSDVADALKDLGAPATDSFDILKSIYDLQSGIVSDLDRSQSGELSLLSSDTVRLAGKLSVKLLARDAYESPIPLVGALGLAARRVDYALSFGAGPMASGLIDMAQKQRIDADNVADVLDGITRASFAFLAYSGTGNVEVARRTADAAAGVAKLSRMALLPVFERAYAARSGIDQKILAQYVEAQTVRLAHGLQAERIETHFKGQPDILERISLTDKKEANRQFGLQSVTHSSRFSESYRERCRRGICVRTSLPIPPSGPGPGPGPDPATQPTSVDLGGVELGSDAKRSGSLPAGLAQQILDACDSSTASCEIR